MSKEFFETMEKIEKVTKDIKFLENSHPEISNKFLDPSLLALVNMQDLEEAIKEDLKKIHSKSKVKNGRLKQ